MEQVTTQKMQRTSAAAYMAVTTGREREVNLGCIQTLSNTWSSFLKVINILVITQAVDEGGVEAAEGLLDVRAVSCLVEGRISPQYRSAPAP